MSSEVNVTMVRGMRSLLRDRGDGGGGRVTYMELFFDLVYVFAVTQLARLLGEHLDAAGVGRAAILLLAVWWAWMYTAWATNWLHPDRRPVRFMLLLTMLTSLAASVALPGAFTDRGAVFAVAYVLTQLGRAMFLLYALRHEPALLRNFQRIAAWLVVSGVLWLVGGFVDGPARVVLWVVAVVVDYSAPVAGFRTPGLGRSTTSDWTISGGHLAERCQLFVIIALGESILDDGLTLSGHGLTSGPVLAGLLSFVGTVALWWVYFDRHAEDSSRAITTSVDPGRLGRSAYTYFHLPIVAGVIVAAVAAERAVAEPSGPAGFATAAVVLGGPWLFLLGHLLTKKAVFGVWSWSRLGALVALAALLPAGPALSPLVLTGLADVVVIAVAVADLLFHGGRSVEDIQQRAHGRVAD